MFSVAAYDFEDSVTGQRLAAIRGKYRRLRLITDRALFK
jgi:hypothetical protein